MEWSSRTRPSTRAQGLARFGTRLERADPVYGRRHLLRPRQAQLPRVPLEVAQGVEASLGYGGQSLLYDLLHAPALARSGEPPDGAGYRLRLAGLGELLEVGEVHALPAELDGTEAPGAGGLAPAAPQVYGGGLDAASFGLACLPVSERGAGREILDDLAGARRRVRGLVVLHQDHTVSHVEVVADATHHYDRRDTQRAVQRAHEVYEGGDGLFVYQLAHPLVPGHEVRRARVLIHQKERSAHLQRLGDVRRLRGRAGGVGRREVSGGHPARQVPDHGRDVHPRHAAAVLGPYLHRVGPCYHQLPAVPRHVVVDPPRER